MNDKQNNKTTEDEILDVANSPSLKNWGEPAKFSKKNVTVKCGWGRLIFAHTFESSEKLAEVLSEETENSRDQTLYVRDPQVVIAHNPENLLLEACYTYRLDLSSYTAPENKNEPFSIRQFKMEDVESINRINQTRNAAEIDPDFLQKDYKKSKYLTLWVAVDNASDEIIALCLGIDHKIAFDDPENGSSLWSLAVDPQATHPGIGLALVHHVAQYHKKAGCDFLDLSVYHDNEEAISLYEKTGFVQIPAFSVVTRSIVNEEHYIEPDLGGELSPYSMIIINEARRRGIRVDVLDHIDNYFALSNGSTNIVCRESLTDLTSSIAISRCKDIRTTAKVLEDAGLNVPDQHIASTPTKNHIFMEKHGSIVVKPCLRIQSAGTTVGVETKEDLQKAIKHAKKVNSDVMLREMIEGENIRILVIDFKVVAAATKKPPFIVGNGEHTVLELVEKQSRRRETATQGENKIPIDKELSIIVHNAGYSLDDVLPKGRQLQVHKTTHIHFGGTIHDVTSDLHPDLIDAAVQAAYALDTPVVGLDFIVDDPSHPQYVIVEANERPHLLNHEPQPTAERFIDYLFPQSIVRSE